MSLNGIRLAELETEIRASLDGLRVVFLDAIDRKIRLGEQLVEAKVCCGAERGAWTRFLKTCKVEERTAREAMQFFRAREEIEEKRHGRAALRVQDIRLALATPRKSPVSSDDSDEALAAPRLGLPSPAIEESAAEVGDQPDQPPASIDREGRIPGMVVAVGQEPDPDSPTVVVRAGSEVPAGHIATNTHDGNHELVLAKFLTMYLQKAEEVILGLEEGLPRSAIERIRMQIVEVAAVLQRLQSALAVLEEAAR